MQFDDWKKRITPDVLKKAGMNEAEFAQFVKDMQAYDALVQKRNAELLRQQVQERAATAASGVGLREVEATPGNNDPLNRALGPSAARAARRARSLPEESVTHPCLFSARKEPHAKR